MILQHKDRFPQKTYNNKMSCLIFHLYLSKWQFDKAQINAVENGDKLIEAEWCVHVFVN